MTDTAIAQPELRPWAELRNKEPNQDAPESSFDDHGYLRLTQPPPAITDSNPLAVVDLFSGCGGMSLGVIEGARRAGRAANVALAADLAKEPLLALKETLSLPSEAVCHSDLGMLLNRPGDAIEKREKQLFAPVSGPTVLVAGPPCQGHSALNNHTRHDDPRNDLYVAVARAVEILRPRLAIVENVRGVGSDRRGAMARCVAHLEMLGYEVSSRRVDLARIGVPQTRVRHVLIATPRQRFEWTLRETPSRSVSWAIDDLLDVRASDLLDKPSQPTETNRERIAWLFANERYDLPNHLRPVCHQTKHSYVSMYGRLRWDKPAQTITSGFGSMGQGRYVHPLRQRTLTPHEAARLQFLPDFVRLNAISRRTHLAETIGNVAPPALTIALTQSAIMQGIL